MVEEDDDEDVEVDEHQTYNPPYLDQNIFQTDEELNRQSSGLHNEMSQQSLMETPLPKPSFPIMVSKCNTFNIHNRSLSQFDLNGSDKPVQIVRNNSDVFDNQQAFNSIPFSDVVMNNEEEDVEEDDENEEYSEESDDDDTANNEYVQEIFNKIEQLKQQGNEVNQMLHNIIDNQK